MYNWNNNNLFKKRKRTFRDEPFPVEVFYTQEQINVEKPYEFMIKADREGIYHAVLTA